MLLTCNKLTQTLLLALPPCPPPPLSMKGGTYELCPMNGVPQAQLSQIPFFREDFFTKVFDARKFHAMRRIIMNDPERA